MAYGGGGIRIERREVGGGEVAAAAKRPAGDQSGRAARRRVAYDGCSPLRGATLVGITGQTRGRAAALLGAVIGEWVGASRGLGYLMLLANGRARIDLMFAALLVLALFTVLLHAAVDRAAQRLQAWSEG